MDRDLVLRCSKSIRLEHKLPQEFTDLIAEFCTIKGHSEHISGVIQLLQHPAVGSEIIYRILKKKKKEFHIIKLERLPDAYSINQKQLINIY